MYRLNKIEQEIEQVKFEEDSIKNEVDRIKDMLEKTPEHFSSKDLLRSFIGALFFGFSVAFSGNIINIARALPAPHTYVLVFFTLMVLSAEIYFIGYSRVTDKTTRKLGQFWIKRLLAFYAVSLLVSFVIAYMFGLIYLTDSPTHFFTVVLVLSVPCAIGASISDLLKKYS